MFVYSGARMPSAKITEAEFGLILSSVGRRCSARPSGESIPTLRGVLVHQSRSQQPVGFWFRINPPTVLGLQDGVAFGRLEAVVPLITPLAAGEGGHPIRLGQADIQRCGRRSLRRGR